ncbi:CMP-N-acetylneuraminate-beta-galactosamide-alpha-2,3-sialyltransferase 1-like [Cololabis saira]|uniref:CMP-N-acetylneuraminate-beta-galactosamide- alpha-2,3-sialyltransferase 1-like n=1 Tax=Cololabis saira TaxID=129043 RepID=UPI002AD42101|nr:CMP-N-acetylneuraminate-beta-galactosamide-alpha-2,3-sialyltransferase 1-like [Cololabis saira]
MFLKHRTLVLVFTAVSFSTLLLTFRDPGAYLLRYAAARLFPRGPCGCRRCVAALRDDAWFSQRFNQSVQPLMTRENSVLTEDTFTWWQWLQAERHPASYPLVVDQLFQLIPDQDRYQDAGPDRCRTCSVVGNSGNLKGSGYGALIDSRDLVIRMNKAPTRGFQDDVGTRTTHHVMYPESAVDLDNDTSLVLVPFKTLDLQWLVSALTNGTIQRTYLPVKSKVQANREKVLVYSPTFFKYVHESWLEGRGRYPSTGFLSLMLALHICDEVSVFGFGSDQYGNWHHYWETNVLSGAFRLTGVHDGDMESNVTLLLEDRDKIQMFRGQRDTGGQGQDPDVQGTT